MFTFPLVLTLMTKLVQIVNVAYFIIILVIFPELNLSGTANIIRRIFWCSFLFQFCALTLETWVDVTKEANKSVIILHDIWNKYAEKRGIDKRLLYLQFISMRFLTCKLKFTAYGFFPLDWTFLHTIIASATTYIIILVQLKK
ncbi:gustatory and pheromone receptor 32a-like isoform X2 [Harmonia axyridis]|uniref:gustatory and pheromone receptor 32a-like isoform X2 n=1 Tax=Harmonia axyridis TaxID=115357 RepID=UPI001E2754AD|nr:gustatory and pheromone receptor 32a-like isoform X2 [Harmonia axyridis]